MFCSGRQDCHWSFPNAHILCHFATFAFSLQFLFGVTCSADLESLLLTAKFQEQTVLVCGSCSMRISDLKLLSFSQGEAPIPGNSIRSLGHKSFSDLPSKSSISSSHMHSKQKNAVDYDDAHTDYQAVDDDHHPIAQVYPKAPYAPAAENFALVCAWKEVPEIQRLFVSCASSAVGGFQVCTTCAAVLYDPCLIYMASAVAVSASQAARRLCDARAVDVVLPGVQPWLSSEPEQLRAAAVFLRRPLRHSRKLRAAAERSPSHLPQSSTVHAKPRVSGIFPITVSESLYTSQ